MRKWSEKNFDWGSAKSDFQCANREMKKKCTPQISLIIKPGIQVGEHFETYICSKANGLNLNKADLEDLLAATSLVTLNAKSSPNWHLKHHTLPVWPWNWTDNLDKHRKFDRWPKSGAQIVAKFVLISVILAFTADLDPRQERHFCQW